MMAHPLALQLRNLQSLVEIGVDKNTTVVFPAPLMSTIGELGAFLAREAGAAERPEPQPPIPIPPAVTNGTSGAGAGGDRRILAADNDLVEKIGGTTRDLHRGLRPSQPSCVRMTHQPKPDYLLIGVGTGYSSVSRLVAEILISRGESVRAMARRDDGFDALRELGAEIVAGDLTNPGDVVAAMSGINRVFFNMSVSAEYLEGAAVVTALARDREDLDVLVNMSHMAVSQIEPTSTAASRPQRLHWLTEHIMNWSGVPVVHVRPTVFLDNPLFTILASQSVAERGLLALPFGRGLDLAYRCH